MAHDAKRTGIVRRYVRDENVGPDRHKSTGKHVAVQSLTHDDLSDRAGGPSCTSWTFGAKSWAIRGGPYARSGS